ncbi:uncharacterized protein [Narcine bancroftii]|uniref:uncharacterized protein isoform X2 n=1 Tax=Narcine bancroftii TaxID=1343680 RepID=UPI0038310B57
MKLKFHHKCSNLPFTCRSVLKILQIKALSAHKSKPSNYTQLTYNPWHVSNGGRKPEPSGKTRADTRRTYKLLIDSAGFEPGSDSWLQKFGMFPMPLNNCRCPIESAPIPSNCTEVQA